ncbi:MAG: hypothetical protein ACREVE_04740 [Gammaproteobacteria bacterium]
MAKTPITALALALLLRTGLPLTPAHAACDPSPEQGLPPVPAWLPTSRCPQQGFEYLDAIAQGVPNIADGVLEACMAEWGIKKDSNYWIETRDAAAAFCPSLPPNLQQACYLSYTLGKLGKDFTKCAAQGFIKGAPIGSMRQGAQAAFDVFFDVADDIELREKFPRFGSMQADEKHKFLRGLVKFWNKDLAEQSQHLQENFVEFFSTTDSIMLAALDAAHSGLDACDFEQAENQLAKAVEAGQASVMDARRAVRASRRQMACQEDLWRRLYGKDWRDSTFRGGGPDEWDYEKHREQIRALLAQEPERIDSLREAGWMCLQLNTMRTYVDRVRPQYQRRLQTVKAALSGPGCELSAVRLALADMERIERGTCKAAVTGLTQDLQREGFRAASADARAALEKKIRDCKTATLQANGWAGTWLDDSKRIVYTISGEGGSLSGSYQYDFPGTYHANAKGSGTFSGCRTEDDLVICDWTGSHEDDHKTMSLKGIMKLDLAGETLTAATVHVDDSSTVQWKPGQPQYDPEIAKGYYHVTELVRAKN